MEKSIARSTDPIQSSSSQDHAHTPDTRVAQSAQKLDPSHCAPEKDHCLHDYQIRQHAGSAEQGLLPRRVPAPGVVKDVFEETGRDGIELRRRNGIVSGSRGWCKQELHDRHAGGDQGKEEDR